MLGYCNPVRWLFVKVPVVFEILATKEEMYLGPAAHILMLIKLRVK